LTIRSLVFAFGVAIAVPAAFATSVTQTLGVQSYTNGDFTDDTSFGLAHAGDPAPFDGTIYGSDLVANFNQSFTFSAYGGPLTVTSASIFIGLYDHDPIATGNQVLSFTAGAVDLTSLLNAAFEADLLQVDTDQVGYYLIILPATVFADISDGSVTFNLQLQTGFGVLGDTEFNGAGLDVATLSATADDVGGVPEPSSWIGMVSGLGALVGLRRYRARS
jgi:hypothetical protein